MALIDAVHVARRAAIELAHRLVPRWSFAAARLAELRGKPIPFGPVQIISADPAIFLSGTSYDEFLGVVPTFARIYGNAPASFIIYPTWSIETVAKARYISKLVRRHETAYPNHRIRYICNTNGETELLNRFGLPAVFLNHKFTVSDRIFRPVPGTEVEFDAIYNARFVAEKRHELAAEIEKVAYIAYAEPQETRCADFRRLWAKTSKRSPKHVLLNSLDQGLPEPLSHAEVNGALARAATGLVLSEIEGASYAAVEYMLAGLPVVSTPSKGGREMFFDADFCAVVPPTPRAVREAAAALKARDIPRAFIREKTLKRLEAERRRFTTLIEDMLIALGATKQNPPSAGFDETISGVPWDGFKHHIDKFEQARKAALERDGGVAPGVLAEVQLTANEMRPIVDALRERPGASLLVFGCGNDSPFWESVNAGGTTSFLENDPAWAETARKELRAAKVHLVAYDTVQAQWWRLLYRPASLAMTLPDEIRTRQWDVIFIDGPAGYRADMPGRMQSIYEASRLVAKGGVIFLHDAERRAERAYAMRYFREGRLVVEATGRATLRGYAF